MSKGRFTSDQFNQLQKERPNLQWKEVSDGKGLGTAIKGNDGAQKGVRKQNKFNATKVIEDGHTFDSKKEYARWHELNQWQKIGIISDLKHHEIFQLSVCKYEADFTYTRNGSYVVEDVKSIFTRKLPLFLLKKKLMFAEKGITILET
jgi:hypothetical protein